jgi:cytochrome c oxidase cbb3-type subunit III
MSTGPKHEIGKTGHVYDGIEELDHPTPNWFQALFYVSILFGTGYFFYYVVGDGPTLTQEYERVRLAEEIAIAEHVAKTGGPKTLSEPELAGFLKDQGKQKVGGDIFQAKCASCHGAQGQGGIGPNLTDHHWIHGGKLTEILATISKGIPEKGMPPWGAMLTSDEIQATTVFVRTLLGTNPAGARAPQGELFKEK